MEADEVPTLTLKELKEKEYKCTDQVLSDLQECFKSDMTDLQACRYSRISHDTYYRWLKLSDEFRELMERSQDFLFYASHHNIAVAIVGKKKRNPDGSEVVVQEPSIDDSWRYLTKREKGRYASRTEVTGPEGNPVQIEDNTDYDKIPLETLLKAAEIIENAADSNGEAKK